MTVIVPAATLRPAAAALVGPPPDPTTPRCPVCRARSGQECAVAQPGRGRVHRTRDAARSRWVAAHGLLVDAVAEWSAAVAAGRPAVQAGQRAAARHRALARRADAAGSVVPVVPDPHDVLDAAGVVPSAAREGAR